MFEYFCRRLALLALLALASGCGTPDNKAPNVNLVGYPPVFRAGYVDGCNSATRTNPTKDEEKFKREPQYAAGWRDGYDICSKKK